MSLARAFTTRRKQSQDFSILPQRSNTTARNNSISLRSKISGPMELTHTTNMLAYNAPDLYPQSEASPTESSKSDDSSIDTPRTSASSPPTSPDLPSVDRSGLPEPNHLSCYFVAPGNKQAPVPTEAPVIPKRSPSHTKKASMDNLANKFSRFSNQSGKSVSTKASFSLSRSSSTSTTATTLSSGSFSRKGSISSPIVPAVPPMVVSPPPARPSLRRDYPDSQHPFGQELAQVSELAEELGVKEKMDVIDEEEQDLIAKGLCRFRPEDYLAEVQGLFSTFFKHEPTALAQVWI
ncbi:uncharacterized protein GGS22DRAFT_4367 [Annulohypoxylon maeteangense]|uniref:uncharacterized protein n=1 Tax=Annulohypoxylon maeteangense TaxID=1927788 RepID=UPI00200867C2|nr:uncharacterized protein GGS22DRAFT_4367 [Annulohypoxylon maeteangense]KAI0889824.1 hypothetical protein GGS22DRAFT_4367 [Annulohypoxylon maeteangense]